MVGYVAVFFTIISNLGFLGAVAAGIAAASGVVSFTAAVFVVGCGIAYLQM